MSTLADLSVPVDIINHSLPLEISSLLAYKLLLPLLTYMTIFFSHPSLPLFFASCFVAFLLKTLMLPEHIFLRKYYLSNSLHGATTLPESYRPKEPIVFRISQV